MRPVKQVKQINSRNTKGSAHKRDGRVNAYLLRHRVILIASLARILHTPLNSAMAVVVMAIAIALAGSFYVLVSNVQQLVDSLQGGTQISLFLEQDISEQQANKLAEELRVNKLIEQIVLISKQQALTEFRQYSGFGEALDALESNPLPIVLMIYPQQSISDANQLKHLAGQMQRQKGVDFVQMDMEWVTRLQAIMQVASKIVMLLSSLLAIAVVFVAGNTIRSELQARRDEVIVTKLVGGTDAYIYLPFLYSGFWYGFISGVLAWCIISLMLLIIHTPITQLSLLYQSQFQLIYLNMSESVLLVFVSSFLGIVGAFIVGRNQLASFKPE